MREQWNKINNDRTDDHYYSDYTFNFFFFKMHYRISLFLALHFSLWWFQMVLAGLSFVKTLYAKDPLQQNLTKVVYSDD